MNNILSRAVSAAQDFDTDADEEPRTVQLGITFANNTHFAPPEAGQPVRRRSSNLFTMQGVGARPQTTLEPTSPIRRTMSSYSQFSDAYALPAQPKSRGDTRQYFDSVSGWISRNSHFHGLLEKDWEKLGGCEYRIVSFLAWLVPVYFVLWQLIG